jgi:hypothetical protein
MSTKEWLQRLTTIPLVSGTASELGWYDWITDKGIISIIIYESDIFRCHYLNFASNNSPTTITGHIDDMKSYHLNKTLKQLFISLED